MRVKNQLQTLLNEIKGDPNAKQLQSLETLKATYTAIQTTTTNKKQIREASKASFLAAAQAATAEATQLVTLAGACTNEINSKVGQGKSSADTYAALGAIGCIMWIISCAVALGACPPMPYILGIGACGVAVIASTDGSTCSSGGDQSSSLSTARRNACEDRNAGGTHIHGDPTGYHPPPGPTTVSTGITNQCLQLGPSVPTAADSACGATIFATDGKGPYGSCTAADDAYKRNNVSCPLDKLNAKFDPNFTSTTPSKKYLDKFIDSLFTPANAGMLSAMGVSKTAVVDFVKAQTPIFADALDTQLAAPVWRAVAWTSLANLVTAALLTTDNMLAQINADIQKINDIINAIKSNSTAGSAGTFTPISSVNQVPAGNTFDPLPCISGASGCQSVTSMLIGTPGFNSLPLDVQNLTPPVAKFAAAIDGATTLGAGALGAANQLSGHAIALQAGLLKRQNNLQGLLNRNGQNINIAKEVSSFSNKLMGITKSGLSAANMTAAEMHGMMGSGGAIGASALPKSDASSSAASKSKSESGGGGSLNGLMLGKGLNKGAGDISAISSGSPKLGVDALSSAEKAVYDTLSEADKAIFLAMTAEEKAAFMAMSPAERTAFLAMTSAERAAFMNMSPAERAAFLTMNAEERSAFLSMTPEERAAFMAMNPAQRKAYLLARLKAKKDVSADDGYSLFEVITNRYKKSAYPRLLKKVKE
jgi:hypothetical protein